MTDTMTLFPVGLDLVTEQVGAMDGDAWAAPSPCAEWSALDVLAHVTGTVHKSLASLSGGDYASMPADAAGGSEPRDVVARWHEAAARAVDALLSADPDEVVSSPGGELPLREALALPVADMAVHAWDIAAAGGRTLELPDDLRAHVEQLGRSFPPERLRSDGLFGPEVEPPSGAGPTERLMAFLGRRPH